ncbi:hypothetical protein Q7P37_009720 [Cladosporium fusiforme]
MASPYLISETTLQELEDSWSGYNGTQAADAEPCHSSAAPIAQVAARSADPAPNHTVTQRASQSQPMGLRLLQLEECEEGHMYNENPPSSIHYTLEWKVTDSEKNKKNKKVVSRNTEQDVVLAPAAYWTQILQPKVKRALRKKVGLERKPRPEETVVVVSVNSRAERDLIKQFEGLNVEWDTVEAQLVAWGDHFRNGKKLRASVGIDGPSDRNKKGRQSATRRLLTQLGEQTGQDQVAGQPAVWCQVYEIMRCPGPPCNLGPHCWRDIAGKKHYRLLTHQLRRLVQYKEEGNKLESHDDVPDDVREELYAVEQQRFENQQKSKTAATGSVPSIQITNVIPGQDTATGILSSTDTHDLQGMPVRPDRLRIVGQRDIVVREYTNWQRSQVLSNELKTQYGKAGSAVLKHGWDLEQLHRLKNTKFLIDEGVLEGIAERFVDDINEWAQSRQRERS